MPFTLLSDESLEVIQAYDVWKEKKMYGKSFLGIVRTTYLIDEAGSIAKASGKVRAKEDPQNALAALDA